MVPDAIHHLHFWKICTVQWAVHQIDSCHGLFPKRAFLFVRAIATVVAVGVGVTAKIEDGEDAKIAVWPACLVVLSEAVAMGDKGDGKIAFFAVRSISMDGAIDSHAVFHG